MSSIYDQKAVKILFDTHWTSDPVPTPAADLAYAISKGVMFPPALLPHDATVQRLRALCDSIPPVRAGNAFLASLSTRELALRSVLGSFAVARFHPECPPPSLGHMDVCAECGLYRAPKKAEAVDLNVLNFERLKWGGVLHVHAKYQWFDLEEFCKLTPPEPTNEDETLLRRILATVRGLPPNATASHLEKAISGIFPANKDERRQLIEVLSLCGVLAYPGYSHYFDGSAPPSGRPDWDTPRSPAAKYWRAGDGYNVERLKEYFPRVALDPAIV